MRKNIRFVQSETELIPVFVNVTSKSAVLDTTTALELQVLAKFAVYSSVYVPGVLTANLCVTVVVVPEREGVPQLFITRTGVTVIADADTAFVATPSGFVVPTKAVASILVASELQRSPNPDVLGKRLLK